LRLRRGSLPTRFARRRLFVATQRL
jgi:hypothetical protein